MTTVPICSADRPGQRTLQHFHVVLDVVARLPHLQLLADADDRGDAVPEGRGGFRGDQRVVLVVVGPALGVTDDDVGTAQLGQERAADLAGVGARVVLREVLRAVGEPQLVTVDQGLHAAQIGERRQHGDVDLVEVLVRQREGDLLHQRDRLEVVEVHLPVAGDQRLAAHGDPSLRCSALRCRAAFCPQGIPATRRHLSKCVRIRPLGDPVPAPRQPSHPHRRR